MMHKLIKIALISVTLGVVLFGNSRQHQVVNDFVHVQANVPRGTIVQ